MSRAKNILFGFRIYSPAVMSRAKILPDESRKKTFRLALEYFLPHVLMVTRRANIIFGCI